MARQRSLMESGRKQGWTSDAVRAAMFSLTKSWQGPSQKLPGETSQRSPPTWPEGTSSCPGLPVLSTFPGVSHGASLALDDPGGAVPGIPRIGCSLLQGKRCLALPGPAGLVSEQDMPGGRLVRSAFPN